MVVFSTVMATAFTVAMLRRLRERAGELGLDVDRLGAQIAHVALTRALASLPMQVDVTATLADTCAEAFGRFVAGSDERSGALLAALRRFVQSESPGLRANELNRLIGDEDCQLACEEMRKPLAIMLNEVDRWTQAMGPDPFREGRTGGPVG